MSAHAPLHATTAPAAAAAAVHRLRPVVAAASDLDTDDVFGWVRVRRDAQAALDELVGSGRLPMHLRVEPDDPPAVVARTLANAWRRATASAATRPYRF